MSPATVPAGATSSSSSGWGACASSRALRGCALTAHVSTKLNRSHLVCGREAIILPCLGRTERDVQSTGPQFVSVENSMSVVHASRGDAPPASENLRSEPWIVARLAEAVLAGRTRTPWRELVEDYDVRTPGVDTLARALSELDADLPRDGVEAVVEFRRPVFLPSRPTFLSTHTDQGSQFQLLDPHKGKVLVQGRVHAAS